MRTTPEDRDAGFTLIELVVVVLVLAILLAIAVPTYLGARNRASDRVVQSNLRNAHTNERIWFADNTFSFTADLVELERLDASLDWTDQFGDLTARPRSVYVYLTTVSGNDAVVVGSQSRPGTCFWLRAVEKAQEPRFAKNDCATVPDPASFGDAWS